MAMTQDQIPAISNANNSNSSFAVLEERLTQQRARVQANAEWIEQLRQQALGERQLDEEIIAGIEERAEELKIQGEELKRKNESSSLIAIMEKIIFIAEKTFAFFQKYLKWAVYGIYVFVGLKISILTIELIKTLTTL